MKKIELFISKMLLALFGFMFGGMAFMFIAEARYNPTQNDPKTTIIITLIFFLVSFLCFWSIPKIDGGR